jgi:hypothetical protein
MSAVIFVCPQCHTGRPLEPFAVAERVRCLQCETSFRSAGFLYDRAAWKALDEPFTAAAVARAQGTEPSQRKWRLLAVAVTRAAFDWCRNPWFRDALQLAETWADFGQPPRGVQLCRTELARISPPMLRGEDVEWWETLDALAGYRARQEQEQFGWVQLAQRCVGDEPQLRPHDLSKVIRRLAASLLRELLLDPFVPPTWNSDWFTSTARDLAAHIYAEREFSAMPILADALQDAGCNDEHILNHCRANKPHARGCWVLDAILGKS